MRARHPSVSTIYNNTPITAEIAEDTQSFSYTDSGSGSSDTIDLTLNCVDDKWTGNWMPSKGSRLESTIIVQDWQREGDNRQLFCGSFLLDDLSFSGEPRTMKLGAVSAPTDETFSATKRTQTWQSVTVQQIAQTIADRSGLALAYDAGGITIETIEQDDTDSAFLASLANSYGLALKVFSSKLVLFDREAYKRKASVATIDRTEMQDWSWNTTIAGTYTGGQLDYTDQDKDADIHVQIGSGSRWLKLNQRASSVADGAIQLAASLNAANHNMTTIEFKRMGEVNLTAAQCIDITGLGRLSGKYYIDKVTHTIDGSGYSCSYSCSLVTPAFSEADAGGYISYNESSHDVYSEGYKSTYQQSAASGGKAAATGTGGAGKAVTLSKCPLYVSSTAKTRANTVSGTYYLYDGINVAGRYRITKPASRCGKLPVGKNVTGWVDAAYIG